MKIEYSIGDRVLTSSGEVKRILATFGRSGYYLCNLADYARFKKRINCRASRPNNISGVKLYRYYQILPYYPTLAKEVEEKRATLDAAEKAYTDARGRLLMLFHRKRNELEEAIEPKIKV